MVKLKIKKDQMLLFINGGRNGTYDIKDEKVVVNLLNTLKSKGKYDIEIVDEREEG